MLPVSASVIEWFWLLMSCFQGNCRSWVAIATANIICISFSCHNALCYLASLKGSMFTMLSPVVEILQFYTRPFCLGPVSWTVRAFVIHIRWESYFAAITFLVMKSLHIYAHTTTAVLSWHVPKCVVIASLIFGWEQDIPYMYLNYEEQTVCETNPVLCFPEASVDTELWGPGCVSLLYKVSQ